MIARSRLRRVALTFLLTAGAWASMAAVAFAAYAPKKY